MSITSSAGSRAASLGGKSSGRSGRNLSPALVVIATAQRWWCRHALLSLRILADRKRSGAYLIMLLLGTAMFGIFFFLTIFVQTVLGYSALRPAWPSCRSPGRWWWRRGSSAGCSPASAPGQQVGGAIGLAALGTVAWTAVASSARGKLAAAARSGRSLASAQVRVAIYHDALATGIARGLLAASGIALAAAVNALVAIRVRRADLANSPAAAQRQPVSPHPAMAGHIHVAGLATESADIGAPYPREGAP